MALLLPNLPHLRVKPYGRRCVLEQALRVGTVPGYVSDSFSKLLLVNKYFLTTARLHRVYSFAVHIQEDSTVFYFEDLFLGDYTFDEDRCTGLSFDQARRIIQLLNPAYVIFYVHHLSQYLQLIDDVQGSIGLEFYVHAAFVTDLITTYWDRLFYLTCSGVAFNVVQNLPAKKFHFLSVHGVFTLDHLKRIMAHSSTYLFMTLVSGFSIGNNNLVQVFGQVKHCAINFSSLINEASLSGAIQFITANFTSMKSLSLTANRGCYVFADIDALVVRTFVIHTCTIYNRLINALEGFHAKTNLKVRLTVYDSGGFTLPVNWMLELSENRDVRSVKHTTSINDYGNVKTILSAENVRENFNGHLHAEVNYRYPAANEQQQVYQQVNE